MLPDVPLTVMGYVPAVTPDPTANDKVELPDPPPMGLVPKVTVTPVGSR